MSYAQHHRKEWLPGWYLNISAVPRSGLEEVWADMADGCGDPREALQGPGSSVCVRSWWSCSLCRSSFPYLMALVLLVTGGQELSAHRSPSRTAVLYSELRKKAFSERFGEDSEVGGGVKTVHV